jgi:uncharacterized membrane protein YbhN (UPF0104 family)
MSQHSLSLLKRFLPYLVTVLIIWLLLRQISLHLIWQLLRQAQWEWVAAGLGWYVVTIVLRAYRLGTLLAMPGWRRPLSLLPDVLALSLINNLLPARAGELSFPLIMQRRHGLAISESLVLLFIVRFFDFLCVIGLFVVFALLNSANLTRATGSFILSLSLLFIPLLVLGALLPWLGDKGLQAIIWFMQRPGQAERPFCQKLLASGQTAVSVIGRVHKIETYGRVLGWSLAGWLTTFAWFTAFLAAINIPVPLPLVIVGATFATLSKALPLATVGGFGAHEAGWAFGFHLIGMPADLAIASGFAINILTLLASITVALFVFSVNPRLVRSQFKGWGRGRYSAADASSE